MRQDPRVPFAAEVRVKCQSWDQFAVVAAQNLSRGGIFLRTNTPAPLHSRVQVILTDPNGSEFQIAGRVAHVVSADRAVVENREPGIGVQFEPAEPRIAEAILMLVRLHAPSHLSGMGRKPSMAPARPPGPAPTPTPAPAPASQGAPSPRHTLAGMLAATEAPQSRPSTPERRTLPVGSGDSGIRPVELASTMLFESAREPDTEDAARSVRREARSTLRGAAPPAPSAPVTEGRRTTLFGLSSPELAATQLAGAAAPAPPEALDLLGQTLRGAAIPASRTLEEIPTETPEEVVPVEVLDDDVPIEVEVPEARTAEPPTFVPAGIEPPTVVPAGIEPPTVVPAGAEPPTLVPAGAEPPTRIPAGEPPTHIPSGDEPPTGAIAAAPPHKTTLVGLASPLAAQADEPPTTIWARTAAALEAEEEDVEIEADEPETAVVVAATEPPTLVPRAEEPATRAVERALPMDRREALRAALRRELRRVWTGTPHEVLGAVPGEALASIRQRLVQRARRFHPNAHLRAAPDVHRLLREITTRLVAAYAAIAREERLQRHMTGAPAPRAVRVSLPPDPLDRYSDITLAAPPAPPHEEVAQKVEAGRSALSERRFDEARRLFEAALELDPDDASARAGRELVLGFFALAAHSEASAQDHFEAALALDEAFDEAALQVRRLLQRRRDGARNPRRLGS